MRKTTVLHIWNTAGVGSTLARHMDKMYQTRSWVMYRKTHDPFGLTHYGKAYPDNKFRFVLRALAMARNYDILHVHTLDLIVPMLKILYPLKPLIMHYHGSRIRGTWKKRQNLWRFANKILVCTRDLLRGAPTKIVEHLPNPINIGGLVKNRNVKTFKGLAFHMGRYAEDKAREYAKKYSLSLFVLDQGLSRTQDIYSHNDFLNMVRQFEYYIDVKRDYFYRNKIIPESSLTGLEALKLGLKVIDYKGDLLTKFPDTHNVINIVPRLYQIYKDLLDHV